MKKVYLELTNRCNLNCIMCYRKSWHETTKDMDDFLLEKCISEIKSMASIEEVVLGGIGEPSYSKQYKWVIEELKDKKITITSNGTIMTDAILKSYVECVDEVVISIDGMSDNFYKIRKFPLEKIVENINHLNALKKEVGSKTPKIIFQMVMTSENQEDILPIIDLADQLDVGRIIFSNIVPAELEDESLALYKMYDKEPLLSLLRKASHKAMPKGLELTLPELMLKTERRCRFIESESTVITVDGFVVPCYRLAHDGKEVVFGREKEITAHYFGQVNNETLEAIWQKSDYVNYRNMVLNNQYPSCMDCDLVDGCDMAANTDMDCFGNVPSCADCLWSRGIVYCV